GLIYVGGAFRPAGDAAVSVLDHGLLYGDGIFEGIRAYNGRVFKLERHIERLFESAKAIRLEIPASPKDVEALVLDACRQNDVAEATADNVFIVTDRALVTPPTSTNLRGVTRETIVRLAEEHGIRTEERVFGLFDLWTAREAFLCGTLAEVVPIASVDARTIG